MEPINPSMKVFVGDFEVVETSPSSLTINLGKHVFITIHLQGVTHTIKPGSTIPLYTEITHANAGSTSIQ